MDVAGSGRKRQAVYVHLLSLKKMNDFLIKCKILKDSTAFDIISKEFKDEIYPLKQFDADRLYNQRLENTDKVENFPIEKYVFLRNGEQINLIGQCWCMFDFDLSPMDPIHAIFECTVAVLYIQCWEKIEDYLRYLTHAGEMRSPIFAWESLSKLSHFMNFLGLMLTLTLKIV